MANVCLKKKKKIKNRNLFRGLLYASPVLLGYLIFVFGPLIVSLYLSFTDYTMAAAPRFIGIKNYANLFSSSNPFFYKSLEVTSYYVFLSVPIDIIFAFFLAFLLNKNIACRSFFRTVFYMPTIVPAVASALVWMWMMDPTLGLFNQILSKIGLPTCQWIYDESSVIPSLVLMSLWTTGTTMIIFLAGLQGIPKTYYEAIEVDGGNAFHKFFYVTLPMITPTLFFNLIMGFISGFQTFNQSYIMTSGGPNKASYFLVYYLYEEAFSNHRMGSACAIAWILFIIVAILTFIIFKTSKSWVYYESGDKG